MSRISLKQLEAFVQVADQSSFRRAAQALNTTQPNISARIASLEGLIGRRLMERDAGSVRLTREGAHLVAKARAVLSAADEFVASAEAPSLFEGTLRLGVTEMVVHSWLGPYLRELRAQFPNLLVDLMVDLSSNLSEALFGNALDLALQSGPFDRRTSGSVELGRYPMAWVASPSLGLGDGVLSLQDIAAHPILTHSRQTLPFQQLERHVANMRNIRLVPSTNFSACLRMTIEGLGVACLPLSMVEEDLAARRLTRLRYLWVPDDLCFVARYHRERASYPIRAAADLAREISLRHNGPQPDSDQPVLEAEGG